MIDQRLVAIVALTVIAGAVTYFGDLDNEDAALLFACIAFFGLASMIGRGNQKIPSAHDVEMQLRYYALELPKNDRERVHDRLEKGDTLGAAQSLTAALERNELSLPIEQQAQLNRILRALGLRNDED